MQRFTSRADAGGKLGIAGLDIGDMRVNVPQAIVASERFDLDCARVL